MNPGDILPPGDTGDIGSDPGDSTGGTETGDGVNNNDSDSNNLKQPKSMSSSETGHSKNVANFAGLLQVCVGMGTRYNPSNNNIKLVSLQTLRTSAEAAVDRVSATYQPFALAVGERRDVFKPLSKLVTRIYNALVSSDVPQSVTDIALTYVRKLQGRRATAKLTEEEKQAVEAETGKAVIEHSASQTSMDSNIDYFGRLIDLLASVPAYSPNETDLQVTTLQAYHTDMKAKNKTVIELESPLLEARSQRDAVLYDEENGLVEIAGKVKKYIKSLDDPTSALYKQATSFKFSRRKKS